ncbi:Sec1-like protein, partial [Jaminaea rosea]
MDVQKAVSSYLTRLLSPSASGGSGMKVLLLDAHTTPIISLSLTQSTLLSHQVYLTDRIDDPSRQRMRHLKCIVLLRPTRESIQSLCDELAWPKYASYYCYFTNVLAKGDIERLAEADEHDVVKEVQEYFADYLPVNRDLFALAPSPSPSPGSSAASTSEPLGPWGGSPHEWHPAALERHIAGLMALLLSLKKKPTIRYERMSGLAKRLGEEVHYQVTQGQPSLFDFRSSSSSSSSPASPPPPLLLILDRRNDPVTPLLSQWTYQAMLHQLLRIHNGRISLPASSSLPPNQRELVLSTSEDPFFASNLYDNYGDLGASIKRYVLDFQTKTASSKRIETVQDMKRFVEEYPEFRKLGGNVSKHVTLLGELSRIVEGEKLLEVSEVEQGLASQESHAQDLKTLQDLLPRTDISPDSKLRLVILYALRYQKHPAAQITSLVSSLLTQGVPESKAGLVFVLLNMAGADQRQDDLFSNEGFFSRGRSALQRGIKGVENVYTQHTPHLSKAVEALMRGRLRETSYPYVGGGAPPGVAAGAPQPVPQEVIVFIVGGATYEEARYVHQLNQQGVSASGAGSGTGTGTGTSTPTHPVGGGQTTRFLLGGSTILNSSSWLDIVQDAATRFGHSIARPPPAPAHAATTGQSATQGGQGL